MSWLCTDAPRFFLMQGPSLQFNFVSGGEIVIVPHCSPRYYPGSVRPKATSFVEMRVETVSRSMVEVALAQHSPQRVQ